VLRDCSPGQGGSLLGQTYGHPADGAARFTVEVDVYDDLGVSIAMWTTQRHQHHEKLLGK
jgi:hypothetical protein